MKTQRVEDWQEVFYSFCYLEMFLAKLSSKIGFCGTIISKNNTGKH